MRSFIIVPDSRSKTARKLDELNHQAFEAHTRYRDLRQEHYEARKDGEPEDVIQKIRDELTLAQAALDELLEQIDDEMAA